MNRYAYKMDGVNNGWTGLEKNRRVYFTDLAPGNYVFRIKTAAGSGAWNPKEKTLSIIILPPWWRSPAAYLFYCLFAACLAYLLVRYYHRRVREENQQKLNRLHFEKEKELYEAKMKFFTNLAHEIKTPLTLIKAPLERVIQKTQDRPDIKNSLAIMERNTERLIDLTNQLLDYRQTEAGGFTLTFTEVNLSGLLQEIFAGFKPLAEQKGLRYHLHLPGTNLVSYADSEAFTKIITNLLSNAVKYSEEKVELRLLPPTNTENLLVEFINDGHLVPPDMREKIFEPFVRLKKNEKQKGTGIGLALARSLTELHGGTITMKEHTTLNIFVLSLPVYTERVAQKGITLIQQNSTAKSPS
jgi:signal transduction histidine kinase